MRILALALLALAALALQADTDASLEPVQLGIDAVPEGNTDTTVGATESYVSVTAGDTFELDIYVLDVSSLIHWELYLSLDPFIIELVDADLHMLLASNPESSLKTEWVTVLPGQHFLGAADLHGAPESGSGVLARLTLEAKAPGLSPAEFLYHDVDGDGDVDKGPRLTALGGTAIGDVTGDGVLDGPIHDALIAVAAPDTDGDGIADLSDNCPSIPNPDQVDSDVDALGDACDNCPIDHNPGQEDGDGDGRGEVCDACVSEPGSATNGGCPFPPSIGGAVEITTSGFAPSSTEPESSARIYAGRLAAAIAAGTAAVGAAAWYAKRRWLRELIHGHWNRTSALGSVGGRCSWLTFRNRGQ